MKETILTPHKNPHSDRICSSNESVWMRHISAAFWKGIVSKTLIHYKKHLFCEKNNL